MQGSPGTAGRAVQTSSNLPPAARARLTRGERQAQQPGGALAQLSRRHRQEGLVHGVNVDVIDLVDAHDVAVAAQQGQHAQQRARQQRPVDQLQDEAKREGRTGAIEYSKAVAALRVTAITARRQIIL